MSQLGHLLTPLDHLILLLFSHNSNKPSTLCIIQPIYPIMYVRGNNTMFFCRCMDLISLKLDASIAMSMSWFFQPLMGLIFFVELAPCTVVEGGSVADGELGWCATTESFSTTLLGALGALKSSSDELLHIWPPLFPLLLFLIWSTIETLGMDPTT